MSMGFEAQGAHLHPNQIRGGGGVEQVEGEWKEDGVGGCRWTSLVSSQDPPVAYQKMQDALCLWISKLETKRYRYFDPYLKKDRICRICWESLRVGIGCVLEGGCVVVVVVGARAAFVSS